MGEEEPKKVESEAPQETPPPPASQETTPPPAPATPDVEAPKDVAQEKTEVTTTEEKVDDAKAVATVDKVSDSAGDKNSGGSIDRDAVLAKIEAEKRVSLIEAWEENEKSKADNKAHKKISAIGSWENSKKASVEAKLKKIEENLELKKAEYVEKMKNEIATIHKAAEEKRAMVEAKREEEFLKVKETGAKYRAAGNTPRKMFSCFGA